MDKQSTLDALFKKAQEQPTVASFGETKERFLTTLTAQTTKPSGTKTVRFFNLKNGIIMTTLLSILALTSFFLLTEKETGFPNQNQSVQVKKVTDSKLILVSKKSVHFTDLKLHLKSPLTGNQLNSTTRFSDFAEQEILENLVNQVIETILPINKQVLLKKDDDTYVFPKLTPEEISANHKQKKELVKALAKFDKKVYAYIPSGTFEYGAKQESIQAFYMGKTEVTNLEYRTFLFDLLIQDRKDEFLIAKPDQTQWVQKYGEGMKPMEELYFWHPVYNNYPAVNMSRAGAELYCKWLTQEVFKYVGEKKQANYNDLRIPGRTEWIYAASSLGKNKPYPWAETSVKGSTGSYLANFQPAKDSLMIDGAFHTAPVNSYDPTELGLYCVSGNVAEMVYNSPNSRQQPGTSGGDWMSDASEIKIVSEDPNKPLEDPYSGLITGDPNVGFRVVMTYLRMN